MQVQEIMTGHCEFIAPDASLQQAGQRMKELDCGFLPIGSEQQGKLEGVITDRDIVLRAVAEGLNPVDTQVSQCETDKVLYCYQTDSIDSAADAMREQQVYRLIVLDAPESKQLRGVVSLGDVVRHHESHLAADAVKGIMSARSAA